jgi:hypothetical protein
MTCTKRYACDLCRDEIREAADGIGVRWSSGNVISHTFLTDSERHLCNRCIEGLAAMIPGLDSNKEMFRRLASMEDRVP